MRSVIHIIGVAHRVQAKPKGAADTAEQARYRQALGDAITQIKPVMVGEEYNETALAKAKQGTGQEHESITKDVAKALHQFCDPDPTERKNMGYVEGSALAMQYAMDGVADYNDRGFAEEVVKYWPRREQFWADKLKGVVEDKAAIFACGDAHVESFQKTLAKNGLKSGVLSRRIGINQADDDWWAGVQAYIKAHPELTP